MLDDRPESVQRWAELLDEVIDYLDGWNESRESAAIVAAILLVAEKVQTHAG